MGTNMTRSARISLRLILTALSVVLVAAIAVQLLALAAFGWLQTGSGQAWLKDRLQDAASATGYDISLAGAGFTLVDGLSLAQLSVADEAGVIATLDRVSLRLDPAALLTRTLAMTVGGGEARILRVPQTESSESEGLKPFALPQVFFTTLDVTAEFRQLVLAEQGLSFAPRLSLNLSQDGNAVTFKARAEAANAPPFLPSALDMSGRFSADTLQIDVERGTVESLAYKADITGMIGLARQAPVHLTLRADSQSLDFLTGHGGKIFAEAELTGTLAAPLLNAEGESSLDELASRGLGTVSFSLRSQLQDGKPAGTLALKSSFRDRPVAAEAAYLYDAPLLAITAVNGQAPGTTLAGELTFDTSTLLAQGRLSAQIEEVDFYAELAEIPVTGRLKADLDLAHGNNAQSVRLKVNIPEASYQDMRFRAVEADISLPDIQKRWPDTMTLKAAGIDAGDKGRLDALTLSLTDKGEDRYALNVKTGGYLGKPLSVKGTADLYGLQAETPQARDIDMMVMLAGSNLRMSGDAAQDALNVKAVAKKIALTSLPVAIPDLLRNVSLDGTADLTGTLQAPLVQTDLRLTPFSPGRDLPDIALAVTGSYRGGLARMEASGRGQGISSLRGSAEIPVIFSLYPFAYSLAPDAPVTGTVTLDLSLASLASAFLPADHRLAGRLDGAIKLSGTIASPLVDGQAALTSAAYRYEPYGVMLTDLGATFRFDRTALTVATLSASDGGAGRLTGSGTIGLAAPSTSFALTLDNFHLLKSRPADGVVSAKLALQDAAGGYRMTGTITPAQVDIIIPEHFQSDIPQLNIVRPDQGSGPSLLDKVALDMNISAPRQIFVRGWGLDAEFGGAINIGGTLGEPLLNGDFSSVRGRYEEFGKRFVLEHAVLRFQGKVPPSPYLDIEATTAAQDVTASVLLTGRIDRPKINFSSVPSLPEDEVLARILFGRDMSRITPFQAVQLAQTLQRFSGRGGGGIDPLSSLRRATGVDDLSIVTDEGGETGVEVGKYLTDKVYLQLDKGANAATGGAKLQVEVTPRMTVESKIGQDAQGGGVFWKWDY